MKKEKISKIHRLNLAFGDRIASFLEKKAQERELSRQAYVRQLILDQLEAEETNV